jgi:hypothetical protein
LHAIIGLAATRCCVACAAIGLAISAEAPPISDKNAKSCILRSKLSWAFSY